MNLTTQKLVWVKAPYASQRGAFSLAARHLGRNVSDLQDKYDDGRVAPLLDSVWRRIENTDSWNTRLPNKCTVDVSDMIDQFNTGRIDAPVLVEYDKNKYWLVVGEQQLQVSRVSRITPKVVIIRI